MSNRNINNNRSAAKRGNVTINQRIGRLHRISEVESNNVHLLPARAHRPMIDSNRMSERELNMHDSLDEDAFSQSDDNGMSTSAQGERVIFSQIEFLAGLRASTQLLFVHDIEQLYFFRYRNSKGSVYKCRDRKQCRAKAIIDSSGVCMQLGSASHSHSSVREDYENILLRNRIRDECTDDDILRHRNLRTIYNRRTAQ